MICYSRRWRRLTHCVSFKHLITFLFLPFLLHFTCICIAITYRNRVKNQRKTEEKQKTMQLHCSALQWSLNCSKLISSEWYEWFLSFTAFSFSQLINVDDVRCMKTARYAMNLSWRAYINPNHKNHTMRTHITLTSTSSSSSSMFMINVDLNGEKKIIEWMDTIMRIFTLINAPNKKNNLIIYLYEADCNYTIIKCRWYCEQ